MPRWCARPFNMQRPASLTNQPTSHNRKVAFDEADETQGSGDDREGRCSVHLASTRGRPAVVDSIGSARDHARMQGIHQDLEGPIPSYHGFGVLQGGPLAEDRPRLTLTPFRANCDVDAGRL